MRLLVGILLLLSSCSIDAAELVLSFGSKHLLEEGREDIYNDVNPGVVYHFNNAAFGGIYVNSYSDVSLIVGKRWEFNNIGMELGATYYPHVIEAATTHHEVIAPFAHATYDVWNWRIGYAPLFVEHSYGVITLQYVVPIF